MYYEDRSTDKLGVAYARPEDIPVPTFEERPVGKPLDRDEPQQKVRAVLMTYCDPKLRYSGITAWEIAGKILDAIREEQ